MKKVIVVVLMAFCGFSATAQEGFGAGFHVGLPVSNADGYSVNVGLDANYLVPVADKFSVGGALSFLDWVLKSEYKDLGLKDHLFLPLAGAGRFMPSEDFSVGADLGYAIGVSENNDGGFYFRPSAAYRVGADIWVNASLIGISANGSTGTAISAGMLFNF